MGFWKDLCGYLNVWLLVMFVGNAKMDERGRVLIPLDAREKLGLKSGTEFELVQDDGVLVLKPIVSKVGSVKSPPLSASEILEIKESEREFSAKNSQVYESTSDLLNALHSERDRSKKGS